MKFCKGNLTLRLHGDWRLETDSTSVSHGQAKQVRVTGIGSESTGIPFNRGLGTSGSKMTGRVRIYFVLLTQPNFESIIKIILPNVTSISLVSFSLEVLRCLPIPIFFLNFNTILI